MPPLPLTPSTTTSLRAVIFRESHYWLAQVLEHDVGVQADDLIDLIARLSIALEREQPGLASLPPAPAYFQDIWARKAGYVQPIRAIGSMHVELGLVA